MSVTRYFHHRDGFSNPIDHTELVDGRLDAVEHNGTRRLHWWATDNLEGFLRRGEWIEFFPNPQHDLFIDQVAADTEHQLAQLERNARFTRWQFRKQKAHARLMEKCFTDTHRARWPLDRSNWLYWKASDNNRGYELSIRIATFLKSPSLFALHALYKSGYTHRIRNKIINQWLDHYARGEGKFSDEVWRNPPWCDEAWYWNSEHYARQTHVSVDDPTKLAFTENLDKLERDIQTRMKPGRFLQRYFSDVLSEQEIREWAHKWERMNTPPEVLFIESDDPAGWEEVYERDHDF